MICPNCKINIRYKKVKRPFIVDQYNEIQIDTKEAHCKSCDMTYQYQGEAHIIKKAVAAFLITPNMMKRKHILLTIDYVLESNIFEVAQKLKVHPKFLNDIVKARAIFTNTLKDKLIDLIIIKFNTPVIELE